MSLVILCLMMQEKDHKEVLKVLLAAGATIYGNHGILMMDAETKYRRGKALLERKKREEKDSFNKDQVDGSGLNFGSRHNNREL